nr:glycerol-3-phosphate acyltransferase [Paenisporosarcina sp. TG-14]
MILALWTLGVTLSGYIIGCLHGSKVAQYFSGINVKEHGVKNSGASNAAIVLGWKYGVLVALFDIGKGIFAVLLLAYILSSTVFLLDLQTILLFLIGAAVVIGHNCPLWMNFDGGKGTASIIGIMLGLDWRMGLIGFSLLIIVTLITNYLPIGVLFLYLTFCSYAIWFTEGLLPSFIVISLFILALWTHRDNILRIKDGTEPRATSVLKKKKASSSVNY